MIRMSQGQGLDLVQIHPAQEDGAQGSGRTAPRWGRPHQTSSRFPVRERQEAHRQEDHQLPHHGHREAQHPVAQSLEHRGAHDGIAGKQEAHER